MEILFNMGPLDLLQYAGAIAGVIGAMMLASNSDDMVRQRDAYGVMMASSTLLLVWGVVAAHHGIALMSFVYCVINAIGLGTRAGFLDSSVIPETMDRVVAREIDFGGSGVPSIHDSGSRALSTNAVGSFPSIDGGDK